jgi:predicted RecB family nuclease
LLTAGVEAARWLNDATAVNPQTPVDQLRPKAKKQIAALSDAGVATAADVIEHVDHQTANLDRWAAAAIINARAATGPEPVYRLPGRVIEVPRADIEIDVDMENTNDGVYQWGVNVTDRTETGLVDTGYRAFISWDPITPEVEQQVFAEFWTWLTDVRQRAAAAGHTVKAYCWHENAENTQMLRITTANADLAAEVKSFITSPDWVDMLQVFRSGWTTGGSAGLKRIAPLAGFEWDVEDPGGGISMLHHASATDPDHDGQAGARQWLLDYNRGDVEATLAIREWLDGSDLPAVSVD